jgi:uncharacterized protein (DUF2235 family)
MRHLIVGTDGTWNKPDQMDRGRLVPSNVIKIVRAVDENCTEVEQIRYYDSGVGTAGWLDKIRGGVTGKGLFKNMRDAYAWLIETYKPDDRLFLFGFSRGAFTVRSLGGLLHLCGIPKSNGDSQTLAKEAAKIYRGKDKSRREQLGADFKERHECAPGTIEFLGVWDTVGALGLPTRGPIGALTRKRHAFHDVSLGANIRHACQALAINERRRPFEPALWHDKKSESTESVVQAWFPGVHTNVGGGYVDAGLSDRTLYWMIRNAEKCGLRFNSLYLERRIDPNWFGELRDSMKLYYETPLTGMPAWRKIGTGAVGESIHFSAIERWSSSTMPDKEPPNLHEARRKGNIPVIGDSKEKEFHEKLGQA